jgi:retron-type reverse transcriptase
MLRTAFCAFPAAGNRNGSDVNNVQNNGNYWSATENNNNNANNLNFNSDEANMNNNNRNNGQSVRLVQHLSYDKTLLTDLFCAYYDARRNKRNTKSQLRFELHLESNLISLYHQLHNRKYKPSPSICFVIEDSVKREVFASEFRDRVVHHLYWNYVADLFERLFIYDSYSCRKGKGTLKGIERLEHHIRSATNNFTCSAYILQLDIQGYFMHIRRSVLYEVVVETLRKYDYTDPLLLYLTDVIINKDPLQNCRYCGKLSDWDGLPDSKCLSKQPVGVGLPIGDLTSQLFSNIFLNKLDRFVTYDLGFKHYGRYVDDLWLIDESKEKLQDAIVKISSFLSDIGMTLHPKKIRLHPCTDKISFLGAVCAPRCRHASRRTTKKFSIKLHKMEQMLLSSENSDGVLNLNDITACLNSYLGYLGHFSSDKYVCKMLKNSPLLHNFSIHRTPNARYGKIKPNK